MDKNLKHYLEEIDHYLILSEGKKEVLAEIESHILEKTEKDFREISKENIQKTINLFGSAKKVAEKYLEGFQIISPSFKNYLFRYTWILFIIHYSLKIISYAFNVDFYLLSFNLSIKGIMQLLAEAPATWIFDFGITALVFYLITQTEKEINLSWPKLFSISKFKILPLKPSKLKIGIIAGLQIISLLVYFKYNTLFFKTVTLTHPPEPLFEAAFSQFMSLLVIGLIFLDLICSILPFFFKTYWINLINNGVYLVVVIFLLSYPFKEIFINPLLDVLRPIGSWILVGTLVIVMFDLFKVLISMIRTKKQ
ncbi:MAG TPA: hypothetical protein DCP02_04905 [Actinobacteria bacterium]|nr:hypothetical protein [Actinomycetota bacterium]